MNKVSLEEKINQVWDTRTLLTEKKYQELTEKYKNEKHKKLKGWGVFFYLVSSFVVWMICTAIFKDNILDNYHINLNFIKRFLES